MLPKEVIDIIDVWCVVFGIDKFDHAKTLVENVPSFDKVDELMAVISIEETINKSLSEEEIANLKTTGFSEASLIDVVCEAA